MTTRTPRGARWVAAIGALAVGLLGFVAPSQAAPNDIDPNVTGTVTVHKRVQPATALGDNDGKEIIGENGTPVAGVDFTLYRVGSFDLSTTEGWDAAQPIVEEFTRGSLDDQRNPQTLTVGDDTFPLATQGTVRTDAAGKAEWPRLALGLYLAVETNTNGETTNVVIPSRPFLVTVPYPEPENAGWNYDVHVYPKNSQTDVRKTVVAGSGDALGQGLQWRITAAVPAEDFDTFSIVDRLDANLDLVDIVSVRDQDGADLPASSYTLRRTSSPKGAVIEFTPAAVRGKQQISVVVSTNVTAIPESGTIVNDAQVVVDGNPSVMATYSTAYGQLNLFKFAKVGEDKVGLNGAEFALYEDADNSKGDFVATMKGGTDGRFNLGVLRPGSYWLVETKVPAGYTRAAETQFEVVAGTSIEGARNYVEIQNVKQNVPELPNTGSNGQLWLTAGGAALLLLALSGVVVSRSRRAKA